MINAKDNYKNRIIYTKCEFCESEDTTEHLCECSILQRLTREEMKEIETVDNMQVLRRIARYIERFNEIK